MKKLSGNLKASTFRMEFYFFINKVVKSYVYCEISFFFNKQTILNHSGQEQENVFADELQALTTVAKCLVLSKKIRSLIKELLEST